MIPGEPNTAVQSNWAHPCGQQPIALKFKTLFKLIANNKRMQNLPKFSNVIKFEPVIIGIRTHYIHAKSLPLLPNQIIGRLGNVVWLEMSFWKFSLKGCQ